MAEFENLTPAEIAAFTQRLVVDTAAAEQLPVTHGVDTGETLIPRSVKLPVRVDRACKARATELGISQSAYIRSLIEKDLASGHSRPLTTADLPLILEFLRQAA
ncbi:hypothetical protein [Nocardia jejuensis]|uniref:hypothetical protein n=1 Tax=Nocardia jejuensis TaxID=328049 RepID=UPI0008350839|nr:hypothetical protein [Nocardia jejuensis]